MTKRCIKKRIPINGITVNNTPKEHINSEEKELNVEKHMAFIKQIAIRASKVFKLDIQDIFNEAVLLVYEYKDKYDYREGKPTTFLNNQITPRLYNKIKRELLPNYFHTIVNENGEKISERVFVKEESLYGTINDTEDLLIDYIDPKVTFEKLDYNKEEENTSHSTEYNEIKELIKKSFKNSDLSDNEIFCLSKKFGIDCDNEETLEEIGQQINKTKEGVRQIIIRSCKKLKKDKDLKFLYRFID